MFRELNFLLQNTYRAIVPKSVQSKLTPYFIRMWISAASTICKCRKKKNLTYVEIRIVDHCNLNCKSCAQCSPLAEPKCVDINTYTADFQRLYDLTNGSIKTIRLMGGEPLLHPQISELMRIVRKIFSKSRIVLVTNGILLQKQDIAFWDICKNENIEILISHYPIKINYESLLDISGKHGIKLRYGTKKPQLMYKWTFDLDGKQDVDKNFYKCYFGNNCIQIDEGKLYNCSIVSMAKHFNAYFGRDMQIAPENFIDIHKCESIDEILKFVTKPIPFCKYCDLSKVQYGEKWESSKRDIKEWI